MILQKKYIIIAVVAVIALQAVVLLALGNPAVCECKSFLFWDGAVRSTENSQHLLDWYSFSHLVYGIIAYFFFWFLRKKFGLPVGLFFLLLIAMAAGWEIFENTQYAIERYQQNTISFDYHGDSVVNSLMDSIMMMSGFWLAFSLPLAVSVALVVLIEVALTITIRDSLLLSSIMFLHPVRSIFNWQASLIR